MDRIKHVGNAKMRRKGTQGSHLSVNTSPTMGSAQKANPIMSGAIIYVLVFNSTARH